MKQICIQLGLRTLSAKSGTRFSAVLPESQPEHQQVRPVRYQTFTCHQKKSARPSSIRWIDGIRRDVNLQPPANFLTSAIQCVWSSGNDATIRPPRVITDNFRPIICCFTSTTSGSVFAVRRLHKTHISRSGHDTFVQRSNSRLYILVFNVIRETINSISSGYR